MKTLTYTGDCTGHLGAKDGRHYAVKPGASVELPDDLAAQLLQEQPGVWREPGGKAAPKRSKTTHP